jgi:GR25 family glycosyltransferase involved in LPS biosynthesis
MKILVISLVESKSRRNYILERIGSLGFEFEFLNATTPRDLPLNKQNSAIAIWDSHVQAMVKFLNSEESCCLIFEDDVDLESDFEIKIKTLTNLQYIIDCLPEGYSIIQFGNMGFKERNFLAQLLRNSYFFIFRRHHFDRDPFKRLRKSLGQVRYAKLQKDLRNLTGVHAKPLEGFTTGAQAYLLNRSAAAFLIENYAKRTDWDVKSRFSLDTYLEISSNSAVTPPQIRTIRLARSIFHQRPIDSTNTHFPS